MLNFVEKLGKIMRESRWETCGGISTFLTMLASYCETLCKMFGFTRSFNNVCTCISTENLFGLTVINRNYLHIYTEPITIITNKIKEG